MFKKSLILFVGAFLGVAITLIANFVFPFNSSGDIISTEYVRTFKPEKILVEYVAYACGGGCPRLTEVFKNKKGKDVLAKNPLFTRYPDDIENPENTKLALSGNRFILTAYREVEMKENKEYQNLLEFTNYIDVVSWEVVTPYSIYGEKGSPRKIIEKSKPVKQTSSIGIFNY